MNTYEIDIKLIDGCIISRILELEPYKFIEFKNQLMRLSELSALYIDDGKSLLIVHPEKIRNIIIREI